MQCEHLHINLDRSVPLGLFRSEFVVNSLKHAFPDGRNGTLTVRLEAVNEQRARLLLADDGAGMPAATPESSRGSGLKLMEQLARQAIRDTDLGPGSRHSSRTGLSCLARRSKL